MTDKKIVLMDVDGVVADYCGHLLSVLGASFTSDEITGWDFYGMLSAKQQLMAVQARPMEEFWMDIPPFSGALDNIKKVRKSGHQIVWVTAPDPLCHSWCYARRTWLQEEMLAINEHFIFTENKEHVRGHVLIDDRPANCRLWQEANPNGTAFLFARPHNREDCEGLYRVGWDEIHEYLNAA